MQESRLAGDNSAVFGRSERSETNWHGQRSCPPVITDMTAAMIASTRHMAPAPNGPWVVYTFSRF